MGSLLFSINATLPVTLMIFLGALLKRVRLLDGKIIPQLNRFTLNVTLPFLILDNLGGVHFDDLWDASYLLLCAGGTLICFLLAIAFSSIFIRKDRALQGELIQGSFRGSAVLLAYAYVQNIYGVATTTSLMVLATVPLYNLLSAALLSLTDASHQHLDRSVWEQTLRGLFKNPVVIGILVGMISSFLQVSYPEPVQKVISQLSSLTSPLALICLGASFEWRGAFQQRRLTGWGTLFKLILQPALMLPLAIWLDLSGEKMVAFLIMVGTPTSVTSYVMAKDTNHEGVLTASLIVTTTILSTFTMTFWIFVLRGLGRI